MKHTFKKMLTMALCLLTLMTFFTLPTQTFAESIQVKKIVIEGGVTIAVGGTCKLKAVINPSNASNKKVTWSSSNKNIATVNCNGVVTGKNPGTVTIKATSKDNKKVYGSRKITVKNVAVSSVKLNKTNYEIIGGKKITLKATVYPSNATNKGVSWSSSNNKIVSVSSNGVVTPKGYGTAYITVKTKSGGKTAKCKVTVPKESIITVKHREETTVDNYGVLKAEDVITLVVDGKTGDIKKASARQNKWDIELFAIIGKDGSEVLYTCKDYVLVKSSWSMKFGVWKVGIKVYSYYNTYKITKDGKLSVIEDGGEILHGLYHFGN